MKPLSIAILLISMAVYGQSVKKINFKDNGIKLSGVLNYPESSMSKGIVLIVHGDGETDAVAGNWWYDVRLAINQAGYTTFMWDKPGCGASEGYYQQNRAITDEAGEVISAIEYLKAEKINGYKNVGLWGISRAGWINPVVISQYGEIDFWISVSGVPAHETFKYLLENNLKIEGHFRKQVDLLVDQWHQGLLMTRNGLTYQDYLDATTDLQKNEFWLKITNGGISKKEFEDYQTVLQNMKLDLTSQLPIYVDNFSKILDDIDVPVLSVFGETDMTVNWRATQSLYKSTIGQNNNYHEITLAECNHNIWIARTGGIYESESSDWKFNRCPGFLTGMKNWLEDLDLK